MLLKRLYFNNFKDPLTNFYWTVVIRNIKLKDGYATLVKTSEDDEYVHIINKVENGKISELVVLNIDGDEVNVVWLKGENLTMDNLGNLSL